METSTYGLYIYIHIVFIYIYIVFIYIYCIYIYMILLYLFIYIYTHTYYMLLLPSLGWWSPMANVTRPPSARIGLPATAWVVRLCLTVQNDNASFMTMKHDIWGSPWFINWQDVWIDTNPTHQMKLPILAWSSDITDYVAIFMGSSCTFG